MKYAKLINGSIRYAPKTIQWQGRTVNNPSEDKLLDIGYLPVTYTDPPSDATAGQHYESHWEQTDTAIAQVWTLADDPVYPEPEPTPEERLEELETRQERTDAAVEDLILTTMGGV